MIMIMVKNVYLGPSKKKEEEFLLASDKDKDLDLTLKDKA
jgi:hypothetical protein